MNAYRVWMYCGYAEPFDQVPAYSNPPSQLLTKKEWDREKRRLLNHIENIFPPRVLQDTGLVRLTTEAEDSINIGKEWPVAGRGNPEVLLATVPVFLVEICDCLRPCVWRQRL